MEHDQKRSADQEIVEGGVVKKNKKGCDKFIFYSKSKNDPPGKGKFSAEEEFVADVCLYTDLAKEPDWRQQLSNFHDAEFEWNGGDVHPLLRYPNGTRWKTIEHAFQASKFWLNATFAEGVPRLEKKKMRVYTAEEFCEIALKFTMNSGHPIGQGRGAEAQKNRKIVWLNDDDLKRWADVSEQVMASAATAKYSQNPSSLRMLQATAPAQLFHLMKQRGKASNFVRFKHLEDIRDK